MNDLFNNNGSKENDVASIDTLSFWESRVHDTRSSTLFEYNVGAFVVVAVYKSGKYQAFVSTPDTIKNDNPIPFFDGSDYNQIGLQSGGKEFSDKLTLSPKSIQLELLQWSHAPDETSSYDKGMPPAFLLSARGEGCKSSF